MNNSTCVTNCTFRRPDTSAAERQQLALYISTTVVVGVGMIGIGCTVYYKNLIYHLRHPKAFLIGVVAQLLLVPLIAWALTKIFQMPQAEALGVMIQGSCPGGTTSNLVVYWMDGIVDLSIAMTATTTLLAMGTLPLWLLIFQKVEDISSFTVPFQELGITLACLVVPLAFGVFLNAKFPKKASIISKILISVASIGVLVILVVSSILRRAVFAVTWKQVVVACLMPLIAMVVGFLVSIIPGIRLKDKSRRTIAVETALQNVQVSAAIIQLTFQKDFRLYIRIVLFVLLYYVFQVSYSAVLIGFLALAKRRGWIKPDQEELPPNNLDEGGEVNPTFEKNEALPENQT